MTIKEIKKQMKDWSDFWGGDIMYDIDACKTKEDLAELMNNYYRYLEDAGTDALTHCEEFKRKLGLNNY